MGDPAGIGPVIAAKAIASRPDECFVVFGDAARMRELVETAGAALKHVTFVDAAQWTETMVCAHRATAEGGRAQLAALDAAIDATSSGRTRAIVTGPTSKAAIVAGGTPFVGQTERLAEKVSMAPDDVTMLFLGERLNVALVTTHLSVRAAAEAITPARVERTVRHLREALQQLGIPRPILAVTGVNPHAGEAGLFGDEEQRILLPTLARLELPPPISA